MRRQHELQYGDSFAFHCGVCGIANMDPSIVDTLATASTKPPHRPPHCAAAALAIERAPNRMGQRLRRIEWAGTADPDHPVSHRAIRRVASAISTGSRAKHRRR